MLLSENFIGISDSVVRCLPAKPFKDSGTFSGLGMGDSGTKPWIGRVLFADFLHNTAYVDFLFCF